MHNSSAPVLAHTFSVPLFPMAPKRKKAGLTRMDAAVDQMGLIGFPKPLVRKTVRNLLKVYGENGWKLIEEDAYKVLLDVILDEQETEAVQAQNLLKDASAAKVVEAEDALLQGNTIASPTRIAESSEVTPLSIKGPGNQECWKDADLVKKDLRSSPFHNGDDHSANEIHLQDSENTSLSLRVCDAVHTLVNVPIRTRKPCYGWISDNEDDDDNDDVDTKFLELAPAT